MQAPRSPRRRAYRNTFNITAGLCVLFALAISTACGSSAPTAPAQPVCHVETIPASDHCDTFFDAAGRPYLLCYTIPASSHQVCK